MDDKRRFYVVRLGEGYVKTVKYPEGGWADWNSVEIVLTTNAIDAAHNQTEASALEVVNSIGGEVCCFGIYDAEPSTKDPVLGAVAVGHHFDWALRHLLAHRRVTRQGWNGKGMWIAVQMPAENSKMDLPYIYMRTVTGSFVPWSPWQSDLLHHDWVAVDEGVK